MCFRTACKLRNSRPRLAVQADIPDGDLLSKIVDETGEIDEVVGILDEEAMHPCHVLQILVDRGCGV